MPQIAAPVDPDTQLKPREQQCLRAIRNRLMTGRRVSIRLLQEDTGYKSPRSVSLQIEALVGKGYLRYSSPGVIALGGRNTEASAQTVNVSVIPDDVPLGPEGPQAEDCLLAIPLSTKLAKPPHRYFLARAIDNALADQGLDQGDLGLIRLSRSASNGDTVATLVDGKLLFRIWHATPQAVILKAGQGHPPIILAPDFQPLGIMVAALPDLVSLS
jgi:SOS-response transcriptional repressor LexA